jgi:hypothetical protein
MIIRSDHPDHERLKKRWLSSQQPREIEAIGRRWSVYLDNDEPFFISNEASEGFDGRYEGSSFHR